MSALGEARRWLAEYLGSGPRLASEVIEAAAEAGVTPATLRRAAKAAGVEKAKYGRPGEGAQGWRWSLPVSGEDVSVSGPGDERLRAATELLGGLVLDDGRRWGEAATTWQVGDAAALLDTAPGVPALHWWGRPRGASKTTDGAACAVAALVEQFPESGRGYCFAVDAGQAALTIEAAAGLVNRSGLGGLLDVETRRIVNRRSDASLTVVAADAASAYGLLPVWLWLDELPHWPLGHRPLWTAIVSAVPKVEGCRLVAVGSAGDPASWVARVLDGARGSDAWRVSDVGGPCPWLSADALEEQRRLLTDAMYARLHLNRWTAAEDRLVDTERLAAAVTLDGPQEPAGGVEYRIGADLGLRHDRTAIAVAHAEDVPERPDARRVVLDRMLVFAGTREREVVLGDVEAALVDVWERYHRPVVRLDPWQAIGLAQRLRARGVSVEEWSFTAPRYAQGAQTLFALLRDGLLALYPDDALLDELANVRLREISPGLVRVDHDPGRHDDQVVALSFAAVPLVERPPSQSALGSGFVGRVTDDVPMIVDQRIGAPAAVGGPIEIA